MNAVVWLARAGYILLVSGLVLGAVPLRAQEGFAGLRMEGGSADDHALARLAIGLSLHQGLSESEVGVALMALKATDRFRNYRFSEDRKVLYLESWPSITGFEVRGCPKGFRGALFPGLRKGLRLGSIQLERFRSYAEVLLRDGGFPQASVRVIRSQTDDKLLFEIDPGKAQIIEKVDVELDGGPYDPSTYVGWLNVKAGKTIYNQEWRRESQSKLRKKLLADDRYLSDVELKYQSGVLRLSVKAGPKVKLVLKGSGIRFSKIKDLVPLDRADRYSPELLEEGVRRIQRLLRSKGYLGAKVWHEDVYVGDRLTLIYHVEPGVRHRIKDIKFERNEALDQEGLQEASGLDGLMLKMTSLRRPYLTPDWLSAIEDRVKVSYFAKGYTEIKLRRKPIQYEGSDATIIYEVREGRRHTLRGVELLIPDHPGLNASRLAQSLLWVFAHDPVLNSKTGLFESDRPAMKGVGARLQEGAREGRFRRFELWFDQRIPLVRHDLALMLGALQDRASEQGFLRIQPRLTFERGQGGMRARIQVEALNQVLVRRLVVQGASRTRAEAILRAFPFSPQPSLSPGFLGGAQSDLGSLGAFRRVELFSMSSLPSAEQEGQAWEEGDLMLKLGERPNWNFSTGFGYDSSQGYHIDLGAQRVNVGGMGRSLDFGIRAGDATLNSPFLRKVFSSDAFTRSVDMYRIAYRDPWFAPRFLEGILPTRTQLDAEGAYLEERRTLYLIRRRRLISSLEWQLKNDYFFQVGYRFERSDVNADRDSQITDSQLEYLAKIKQRTVVSAPYLQLVKDRRDNPYDPTKGVYGALRMEFANQLFGSGKNTSFVKMDLRHQWNWAMGERAAWGVVSLYLRAGAMVPTGPESAILPLAERFFAGGPGSHRGIEPDFLGPILDVKKELGSLASSSSQLPDVRFIPIGGQGLALASLEYRFPIYSLLWGEVFADSGQVYERLRYRDEVGARFPGLRTSLGLGLMLKLGIPIKAEFAWDAKRLLGKPRSPEEQDTKLQKARIFLWI